MTIFHFIKRKIPFLEISTTIVSVITKLYKNMNYEILVITISWSASLSFTHNYKLYFMTFPDILLVIRDIYFMFKVNKTNKKKLI